MTYRIPFWKEGCALETDTDRRGAMNYIQMAADIIRLCGSSSSSIARIQAIYGGRGSSHTVYTAEPILTFVKVS